MANPLILKSLSFNEYFNFSYFPSIIHWDRRRQKWSIQSGIKKLIPYYASLSVSAIVCICAGGMVFTSLWLGQCLFQPVHVLSSVVIIILICFVILSELPWLLYSKDIVSTENALFTIDARLSGRVTTKKDIDDASCFASIRKILRRRKGKTVYAKGDVHGIYMYLSIFLYIASFLLGSIIYTYYGFDPFSVIMIFLGIKLHHGTFVGTSMTILHFSGVVIESQLICQSLRFLTLFVIGSLETGDKVLTRIVRDIGYSNSALRIYFQLQILLSNITSFAKLISAMYLTTAFGGFVFTMVISIKGWNVLPPYIYWGFPTVTCVIFGGLIIVLKYAGSIFEISGVVLMKWKKEVANSNKMSMRERRLARISLKMMWQSAIPVGNVGILDKDIKTNYVVNMQDYAINALVTAEELMG
ncbi:unnamed protein product [Orchesella dallaii]|uniref:Gustatory receptor n=1 Tax=Orchesella dallaii TaxID=48710 RepID=A0ABP1RK20_9HEXA